jgi:hypothetical protein
MPIFCCNVNFAFREKLVPITRHNGASIGPDIPVMTLVLAEGRSENSQLQTLRHKTQESLSEQLPYLKCLHRQVWFFFIRLW